MSYHFFGKVALFKFLVKVEICSINFMESFRLFSSEEESLPGDSLGGGVRSMVGGSSVVVGSSSGANESSWGGSFMTGISSTGGAS